MKKLHFILKSSPGETIAKYHKKRTLLKYIIEKRRRRLSIIVFSENRIKLAKKLIQIEDNELFVDCVNSACETEEMVKKVLDYIIRNGIKDSSEILGYVVDLSNENIEF